MLSLYHKSMLILVYSLTGVLPTLIQVHYADIFFVLLGEGLCNLGELHGIQSEEKKVRFVFKVKTSMYTEGKVRKLLPT